MSSIICIGCGQEIDREWIIENKMFVPLCKDCMERAEQRFAKSTPLPSEYTERCNLK